MRSSRHEEALRYAADGIPVFPCRVNGKEPACLHGHKDATTDERQINEWWTSADYNIGLCPEDAGWAVVDLDFHHGGLEAWDNLVREHVTPRTSTVGTPGGGRHVYFVGSLPASVSKIGTGIDTRGIGSYVLVPPSVIDGKEYQWADDCPTAPLPAWISKKLEQSAQTISIAAVDDLDLPENITRARKRLHDLVAQGDVAIEGKGGDHRTYQVAAEIRELGISPETTLDLMFDIWNPHCLPRWERDELGVKIENASRYAQNAAGAFAVGSTQEAFGPAIDKLKTKTSGSPLPRFYAYSETEQDQMPEPSWLLPDLLPDNSVVMMYGPTESYKSFLALDIALGLAYGVTTFGAKAEPMDVVYIAGEGPRSITRHRRPAWKVAREVTGNGKFYLVKNMPLISDPTMFPELATQLQAQKLRPKLIVIDTAAKAMAGLNENDARDVTNFLAGCDMLKENFGATILFVHHMSDKKGAETYRGSSALAAGVDATARVIAWKATKAVSLQIEKMKDAEARPEPWTFEGRMIGRSLVFFPTTAAVHAQLTRSEDMLDRRKIGAALTKLGAIGRDKAVVTPILAAELLANENQGTEERQTAIGRLCRALGSLARTTLVAYCERDGQQIYWFLPSES